MSKRQVSKVICCKYWYSYKRVLIATILAYIKRSTYVIYLVKKLFTVHIISAIYEMYFSYLCTLWMKSFRLEPHFLLKWCANNPSQIKCPHNYIGLIMYFVAFQRLYTSWVSKTWIHGKAWSLFQEYQTTNNFIGFRWIWHSGI